MNIYKFKAISIGKEIDLSVLARHFGIEKKFKWDEPLLLKDNQLSGVLKLSDNKMIYAFHFGSMVFVNFEYNQVVDTINYFKNALGEEIKVLNEIKEEFVVEVSEDKDLNVNYNSITMKEYNDYYMGIVALVLAKSVSLEKVEKDMVKLFDEIEPIMTNLEEGKFKLKDKELSKISAKILRVKYDSISYFEILDKPDIAWKNEGVEDLYVQLSELFELGDRFETVKNKSQTLKDIIEVFGNLSHNKSGEKLEWIVIVLIAIELIVALLPLFK